MQIKIMQEMKDYFFIAVGVLMYSVGVTLFMLPYSPHPSQKRNVWNTYLKNIIASLDEAGGFKKKPRCEKSPAVARLG